MESIGGFELISSEEMDKYPIREYPELKYKTTKNHFTIYIKNKKGKWVERYNISKDRSYTAYQQMDWALHMNAKIWINGYKFIKEYSKAIEKWGYTK